VVEGNNPGQDQKLPLEPICAKSLITARTGNGEVFALPYQGPRFADSSVELLQGPQLGLLLVLYRYGVVLASFVSDKTQSPCKKIRLRGASLVRIYDFKVKSWLGKGRLPFVHFTQGKKKC